MAKLSEIIEFTDEVLNVAKFKDYCPNGLQVEGDERVVKIVSGVTASLALIDSAIKRNAQLILVHHGYFWRGENEAIAGVKRKRIQRLLNNNISLLVYHLPLDAHKDCGNNAQLAKKLMLEVTATFGMPGSEIGLIAKFKSPITSKEFSQRIESKLKRKPMLLSRDENKRLTTVAICTGGAQSYFEAAIASGVDAFITGEVSEQNYHLAMETGVDFFAAGHHATERYGVQALAELLVDKFSLEHEFIDIDNPV